MEPDEQSLIERLKQAHEDAFDDFLDRYGERLYRFASRLCRNEEDARDVVQETLMALFRSLQRYRGEGRFQTWLFTIASNACRKMRRKGKFDPAQEISLDQFLPGPQEDIGLEIADESPTPEAAVLKAELAAVVEAAIADLPAKYRIVLVLRDIEQFSTDEVARILGLRPEAVKSRLHRARLWVRHRLVTYWHAQRSSGGEISGSLRR
jgi:RNA polymerase sigma-70 factor (ECF subfamily)